jgi:hypothetical protein
MEEFVACGMHPLTTSVGFDKVATLVTPVSKLKVHCQNLLLFAKMMRMMLSF